MDAALRPDADLSPAINQPPPALAPAPCTRWCLPAGRLSPYRATPWQHWVGRLRRVRARWRRLLARRGLFAAADIR